ncbi:MAG: Crp/Fnr family transcriptional regulator [Rhizobiales bacterium]|nr:Crp/Fnr family transcriptional regulator [Hyphomicrobiales bacterium]
MKNGPGNRQHNDPYWKNHRPAAKTQASVAERQHSAPAWTESAVVAKPRSPNYFLASLPATDFGLLRPHLKTKELVGETVLFEAGDSVDCVYFPRTAIVSLVVTLSTGEMIEAAMVGRDGIVNGLAALGRPISLCRAVVQMAGESSVLDLNKLRRIADRSSAIRTALVRHEQFLRSQVQQSAACNATHSVEARLSRWLLRAHELNGTHALLFTQEFLAEMLGVRRTSVSLVANTLQQAGLIKYRRGQIQITNLEGLQEVSCECHETVKASYKRLLGGPSVRP